jgi:hypothetical protein
MVNEEIKRQVRHLSKKFNVQKIRWHLKKIMPRRKVLSKSVRILERVFIDLIFF